MGRPAGSRNRDYAASRDALVRRLGPHLLTQAGGLASLSELSAAAGVSPTTLRHYFTDRDGIYESWLETALLDSGRYLAAAADPGDLSPEQSLPALLTDAVQAWRRHGLGPLFGSCLALALQSSRRGPTFLQALLEPLLQAAESRLAVHVQRGELADIDVRSASLSLVAPIVLALLHQDNLGGQLTRQLDVEQFAAQHCRMVLLGLAPPAG